MKALGWRKAEICNWY